MWDVETRQPVNVYATEDNDSWRNVQVLHVGLSLLKSCKCAGTLDRAGRRFCGAPILDGYRGKFRSRPLRPHGVCMYMSDWGRREGEKEREIERGRERHTHTQSE